MNKILIHFLTILLLKQSPQVLGLPDLIIGCSNENIIEPLMQILDTSIPCKTQAQFSNQHTRNINVLKQINRTILVSGSDDNTIKLWDFVNGVCLNTLPLTNPVLSLILLPNGCLAGGLKDGSIHIIRLSDLSILSTLTRHTARVNALELLENGDMISGSDDGLIIGWDKLTYSEIYYLQTGFQISCLKRLPGNRMAMAFGLNSTFNITIWNMNDTTVLFNFTAHNSRINALEYMGNDILASASDDTKIKLWDLKGLSSVKVLNGHTREVVALKRLPSGELASGSFDRFIRKWDIANALPVANIQIDTPVLTLEILDPLSFLNRTDLTICKSSTTPQTSKPSTTPQISLSKSANSPKLLAVGFDNSPFLELWDPLPTNGIKSSLVFNGQGSNVKALKWYNETILICASDDNFVRVWDLTTGYAIVNINTLQTISAIIVLPNGILVTAEGSNEIKLWSIALKKFLTTLTHSNTVNALEVLNDGFASGGEDNLIKIWDNNGVLKNELNANNPVKCLKRISSDLLASGLSGNNHVLVWFLNNQSVKCDLSGHTGTVNALELLSNEYLASGGADNLIMIWNVADCLPFNFKKPLVPHVGAVNALKLIDFNLMASGSADKTVIIWNMTTGTQLNKLNINSNILALDVFAPPGITNSSQSIATLTSLPSQNITLAPEPTTTTTSFINPETNTVPSTTELLNTTQTKYSNTDSYFTPNNLTSSLTSNQANNVTSIINAITSSNSFTTTTPIYDTNSLSTTPTHNQTVNASSLEDLLKILAGSFKLNELPLSYINALLNSSYDLTGCLVNCTNQGFCKYVSIENRFICSCNTGYHIGAACQIDTRPCSLNPCLNDGRCIDKWSSLFQNLTNKYNKTYICMCPQYYDGPNCELKLDLCQNETCSNNGNCVDNKNSVSCECYYLYEGSKCSSQSVELKLIKTVSFTSFIIALIAIISTYCLIVCCDASKYCIKTNMFATRKAREIKSRSKIRHLIYQNFNTAD